MPRIRAIAPDLGDAPRARSADRSHERRYNSPAAATPLRTAASSVAGYGPAT